MLGRAIVLNCWELRSIATSGKSQWQVNASVTFDLRIALETQGGNS